MRFSMLFVPVLVGAILAVGLVAGFAGPARAHNSLVSSSPEAGSTITELPEAFSVTTNDDLFEAGAASGGFALQVVGSDGLYYGDGCVQVAGPTMSAVPALGPAGEYALAWQVVSIDGHPVDGRFNFTWAPAPGAEVAEGSPTATVCGETSDADPAESPAATPSPEPSTGVADPGDDASLATTLWIGAAVATVAVTALVMRNRRKKA